MKALKADVMKLAQSINMMRGRLMLSNVSEPEVERMFHQFTEQMAVYEELCMEQGYDPSTIESQLDEYLEDGILRDDKIGEVRMLIQDSAKVIESQDIVPLSLLDAVAFLQCQILMKPTSDILCL